MTRQATNKKDEEHKVRGFALTDLRHVSVEFTVHVPMLNKHFQVVSEPMFSIFSSI